MLTLQASDLRFCGGALGQIRTADTRFRRAVLYPLSYEGGGQQENAQENPGNQVLEAMRRSHRWREEGYRTFWARFRGPTACVGPL